MNDDPPRGNPAGRVPPHPPAPAPSSPQMADPKLVIEAEPEDLVLESIAPPEASQSSNPGVAKVPLGAPVPKPPGSSPSASRGPVLPMPQASKVGPLPPPPSNASNPRLDRPPPPPPPTRGTPASGTNPRALLPGVVPLPITPPTGSSPTASSPSSSASSPRAPISRGSGPDSSNQKTVPAPPRDGSAKLLLPVPATHGGSAAHERSSVTARDAVTAGGRAKPPSQPGMGSPPPAAPGSAPDRKSPVATVSTPGRAPGATPATGTKLGRAPVQPVTSGSFQISSGVHAGQLAAYKSQSALMRMMAPFVEDPRPGWLLAGYFAVGVAVGIGAAFGLWGQTP